MTYPFPPTNFATLAFVAFTALAGCDTTTTSSSLPAQGADPQLVARADIMSRSIIEGAVTGAGAGALVALISGESDDLGLGFSIGTLTGAVAGTYVGYLQSEYAQREAILARLQSDLDRNSAEIEATINVMRGVLAVQQADLAALRAGAAAGTVTPEAVAAGTAEAQANLQQMTRAINGAATREAEFVSARQLVGTGIDSQLGALARQIAEMQAIADDLARNI